MQRKEHEMFGHILRQLRKRRGYSAQELARRTGKHREDVYRIEWEETKKPSIETALTYLAALGYTDFDQETERILEESGYEEHAASFIWKILLGLQSEEVQLSASMNQVRMILTRLIHDVQLLSDLVGHGAATKQEEDNLRWLAQILTEAYELAEKIVPDQP